ncbi:MAG: hypothetical protein LBG92_06625 [Prevotellaceae bacterium]|nr:hypothetical protein [Prevotellaceae bacterium]
MAVVFDNLLYFDFLKVPFTDHYCHNRLKKTHHGNRIKPVKKGFSMQLLNCSDIQAIWILFMNVSVQILRDASTI